MQFFVEVWTTHQDKTCTLMREHCKTDYLARLREAYLLHHMESHGGALFNDFGEHVSIEITCHKPGLVKVGVFHFAD